MRAASFECCVGVESRTLGLAARRLRLWFDQGGAAVGVMEGEADVLS